MRIFIIRKIIRTLFIVWVALTVAFLALHFLPGSPVQRLLGISYYHQNVFETVSAEYDLNKPIYNQYTSFLGDTLTGNWGDSIINGRDINTEVQRRLPFSLIISIPTFIISLILGLVLSMIIASSKRKQAMNIIKKVVIFLSSIPPFIIGIAILLIAALIFHSSPQAEDLNFISVFLSVITLTLIICSYLVRHLLVFLEEESKRRYILFLVGRGISNREVWLKHILRNSLVPIITVSGLMLGYLIVGTIIVETIFGIPGIGRMFFESILNRDYPVVQAIIVIAIIFFAVVNLLVDFLHIVVDPRLRHKT